MTATPTHPIPSPSGLCARCHQYHDGAESCAEASPAPTHDVYDFETGTHHEVTAENYDQAAALGAQAIGLAQTPEYDLYITGHIRLYRVEGRSGLRVEHLDEELSAEAQPWGPVLLDAVKLEEHEACEEWAEKWNAAFPEGLLLDIAGVLRALKAGFGPVGGWAVEMELLPRGFLRGADLQGADLRGAYLQGADLQGADLQGADLQGADLQGADLQGADLQGAYLRGAYLQGADLQGADLQGAYLQGAYLQGAYLQGAYLRGADLRGAYLRGADLQGADLQGAYLQGAYLQGADLRGADLRGAYLRGADLQGADLQGADLQGAYLQGADLQGADLRGADLQGAYLRGAYLQGADLQGAEGTPHKGIETLTALGWTQDAEGLWQQPEEEGA